MGNLFCRRAIRENRKVALTLEQSGKKRFVLEEHISVPSAVYCGITSQAIQIFLHLVKWDSELLINNINIYLNFSSILSVCSWLSDAAENVPDLNGTDYWQTLFV